MEIDVVGEVLPRAGDTRHARLTAELGHPSRLRARRADLRANVRSCSTIALTVSFSSRTLAARFDRDLPR